MYLIVCLCLPWQKIIEAWSNPEDPCISYTFACWCSWGATRKYIRTKTKYLSSIFGLLTFYIQMIKKKIIKFSTMIFLDEIFTALCANRQRNKNQKHPNFLKPCTRNIINSIISVLEFSHDWLILKYLLR